MQLDLNRTTRLHLLLIVAATFVAFGAVLNGYFIADDTWQLQFANRALHGEPELVTGNFLHSYLSLPSLDFYRPLLGITYVIDFALYGASAAGYYFTNLLLAALSGILLYFIAKVLCRGFDQDRIDAVAFTSALLFVTCPLHCEDVCWISGRADLLATPFFFAALLAAIFARDWQTGKINHRFHALSLVTFAFGLMSKESAVTLPLVVAFLFILWPGDHKGGAHPSKKSAIQFGLFLTPYLALTFVYLLVRQRALGTFIGGYTGDIGEALSRLLVFRWFDPFNFIHLVFPVARDNFFIFHLVANQTPATTILGTIYAIILGVVIARATTQQLNLRLPLFLILWLIASFVPLIKLWGLDESLHNERVLYLFTAPLSMMLPSLIFAPKLSERSSQLNRFFVLSPNLETSLTRVGTWSLYTLTVCSIALSSLMSYNWVLAGLQIKAIQKRTGDLIAQLANGPDKKILVVSVPNDYLGAHVLTGGINLIELLEPPFTKEHISQYTVSFQRAVLGSSEPVSSAKLKQVLFSLHDRKGYFWDVDRRDYKVVRFEDVPPNTPEVIELPLAISDAQANKAGFWRADPPQKGELKVIAGVPTIALRNLGEHGGDGLVIEGLEINPLAFDYVNLTLSMPHAPTATGVYLTFDDKQDARTPFDQKPQICKILRLPNRLPGEPLRETSLNFKVSHFSDWFSYRTIRRLKISFTNVDAVAVSRISIRNDSRTMPRFSVVDREPRACGEYFCTAEPIRFKVTAPLVAGAKSCQVDISKANHSWDAFVISDVHGKDTVINRSYKVPLLNGEAAFELDQNGFAEKGFYDVRVAVLNENDEIISDWSDLITLYRPDPTGTRAAFCADY